MNLWENLITVGILIALFIIFYCKVTKSTLVDFFNQITEILAPKEVPLVNE